MKMTYQELRDTYGPNAFKIYAHFDFHRDFLNPTQAPLHIQFKTGLDYLKPQKIVTLNSGQVENAIYSASKSQGVSIHPLVKVSLQWVRNEFGVLIRRDAEACWSIVGENDNDVEWSTSPGAMKSWEKGYEPREASIADQRRRRNIIDHILSQVESFGVLSYVQSMFLLLDDEVGAYKSTYDTSLIKSIIASEQPWLDADVSAQFPDLPEGKRTLRYAVCFSLDYDLKEVLK